MTLVQAIEELLARQAGVQTMKTKEKGMISKMVSYVEVLKKDEQFAMCELEMVWTVESRKMNYLPNQTRVVYVPLAKFKKFGYVNVGDVFTVLHDEQSSNNTIISVCARDDEARAKRRALKKRDAVQV